jgi:uncharacterized protein
MLNYLGESLHWIHLALFKPHSLEREAKHLGRRESLVIYFKVFPIAVMIALVLLALIGFLCKLADHPFNWRESVKALLVVGVGHGLIWGSTSGLVGRLGYGLLGALNVGLIGFGLTTGLIWGLGEGLGLGLALGLGLGLNSVWPTQLMHKGLWVWNGLIFGLGGLLIGGWLLTPDQNKGLAELKIFAVSYLITFLLLYLRPFYLLPYLIQFRRAKQTNELFKYFRCSPIYWDEVIAQPLPYLADWLVMLFKKDRERGLAEILFLLANRPFQRRAARSALVIVLIDSLQTVNNPKQIVRATKLMKSLPEASPYFPKGFDEALRRIKELASIAKDYSTRMTVVGQLNALGELRGGLEALRDAMGLTKGPVGPEFQLLATRWLETVKKAEAECQKQLDFISLSNPFVAGNPLQPHDVNLFKGRKDIIVAIEENIINLGKRPALLLYGRRRIGKSSTLLNLSRLLSSQYVPVYLDCQNAKWRDSDAMFCYQLVKAIYGELFQRTLHAGLSKPQEGEFKHHTFTRFDDYLDRVENLSRRIGKQLLLTFDEYERMEEGVRTGSITREVFNQLRHIVQHRERLVVLFSGSHRFEEARTVNWADYLINVKTLELSYLMPDEARELVERPVPDFNLLYEPGVVERILQLTHGQPYLLQTVASDLVNYLNGQKRQTATLTDLEVAVEKVLVTAQAYFHYLWSEDCNDAERELLHSLVMDEAVGAQISQHQDAWQSLNRKEIVELCDNRYHFTVELFRRWILKNQIAPSLHLSTNN